MNYRYAHPELFDSVPRTDFRALSGKLVIYGAGFQGLLAAELLAERGIEALCFGDRDERKQGTSCCGLPVYSPEEMRRRYPDAVPIVTPYVLLPAWKYVTEELGYSNAVTPFSLFLDFDSAGFDRLPGLPAWYRPEALDVHVGRFLNKCANLLTEHALHSAIVVLTEVCNLRCKNCLYMMPSYRSPRHYAYEDVLHDMDALLRGQELFTLVLAGGEPMLWEPLPRLLRALNERPELARIFVVTNGTRMPGGELLDALGLPKVTVRISDYGALSRKEELLAAFDRAGVDCCIQQQQWYELTSYRKEPACGEELARVLDHCCELDGSCFYPVVDGKLFCCPEQASLHNLGVFPAERGEYVDLRQEDPEALRRELAEFMDEKHTHAPLRLCAHCHGRGTGGREVPPAEQLAPGETMRVRFE